MPLDVKPQPNTRPDEGYFFVYDEHGNYAGRIYDGTRSAPPGTAEPWFWGLDYFRSHGVKPYYGSAASKEQALDRFQAAWNARPNKE